MDGEKSFQQDECITIIIEHSRSESVSQPKRQRGEEAPFVLFIHLTHVGIFRRGLEGRGLAGLLAGWQLHLIAIRRYFIWLFDELDLTWSWNEAECRRDSIASHKSQAISSDQIAILFIHPSIRSFGQLSGIWHRRSRFVSNRASCRKQRDRDKGRERELKRVVAFCLSFNQ